MTKKIIFAALLMGVAVQANALGFYGACRPGGFAYHYSYVLDAQGGFFVIDGAEGCTYRPSLIN